MKRKLYRTTGRLVRRKLRTLADGGVIRDARVRVDRTGCCCRCRISSHTMQGSAINVEAVGATRARAVYMAVRRLRDRVRDLFGIRNPFGKENTNDQHDDMEEQRRPRTGHPPRRRIARRFHEIDGG